jgi:hypothetical protein
MTTHLTRQAFVGIDALGEKSNSFSLVFKGFIQSVSRRICFFPLYIRFEI